MTSNAVRLTAIRTPLRTDPRADLKRLLRQHHYLACREPNKDIRASGFDHGIGPGVYDIHSPRVPSIAEVTKLLDTALASILARQLWVNPDCGLKTRGYAETVESLQNILAATRAVREKLAPSAQ